MTVVCFSFKIHVTENSVCFDTFLKHRGSVFYDTFNLISNFKALDKKHSKECPAADIYLDKGLQRSNP